MCDWGSDVCSSALVVNSGAEHVTLPGLQSWTWYCVKVQSRFDYYNKTSSFSSTQCMQTEGETRLSLNTHTNTHVHSHTNA